MVIHHGGAGTFMTASHSGVPQLVVPFFGDQFMWASYAMQLKIGYAIPAGEFDMEDLLKGFETCLDTETKMRAFELGKELRN